MAGHVGAGEDRRPGTWLRGATLLEGGTGRAWVLLDDGDPTGLVPALAWAERHDVDDLHLLVEGTTEAAGVVARRAALWRAPPTVWRVPK